MTCPDRPHDLDLLLAGEPTAPGVQAHLDGCATCAAEAALARRIDAALASHRAVSAPPEVIAAALAQARPPLARPPLARPPLAPAHLHAPDRPARAGSARGLAAARPSSRLWRVGGVALAALLLATLSWTALRSPEASPEAVVAENEAPIVPERATPLAEDSVDIEPDADVAPEADAAPERLAQAPRSAPRRIAPRRRAPRAPSPASQRLAPEAPALQIAPDTAPDPLLAENEPTPTPQDIERAEAELQLAFSLIADAQVRAGRAVRSEAGALSSTLDSTLPF